MTRRIRVYGIVQGVGFRPTVSRHAMTCGVTGSVCNKGPYVEIIAQGQVGQLDSFKMLLENEPPKMSSIIKVESEIIENATEYASFDIIESEKTKGEIFISPDLAICEDCERELFDPTNRRYLHPFINCTCCGPRLTILEHLPYDRERTSMKIFPMCRECASEYKDPATRRYDAQPVCCPSCGPRVYAFAGSSEHGADSFNRIRCDIEKMHSSDAITAARKVISEGGIAAVKGIGGFHLCCNAASTEAVQRLRKIKHRPIKPFAVMAKDLSTAKRECEVGEPSGARYRMLTGREKPIVLLKKKNGGHVCEMVAPGNLKLGIMLPYAPIHHLLFSYPDGISMPDVLVMTSGNASGAPICRNDEEAMRDIAAFCDLILSHDRPINLRADDSVVDFFENEPYMVRRSRGFAPLPVATSFGYQGNVLSVGGDLKNNICLTRDGLIYPSPYIGDMEDLRSEDALREAMERMMTLLDSDSEVLATDLHPKYHSVETAVSVLKKKASFNEKCVLKVQHHYAHILSCLAENDYDGKVIGVSYDGTGFGPDETIWGGEILIADTNGFERAASVMPFFQAGGDAAAKEGWRIACGLLAQGEYESHENDSIADQDACIESAECESMSSTADINSVERESMSSTADINSVEYESVSTTVGTDSTERLDRCEQRDARKKKALSQMVNLGLCDEKTAAIQFILNEQRINGVMSTSIGRLFDAVSAVLGICRESTFEGEAAQKLQVAAERFMSADVNEQPAAERRFAKEACDVDKRSGSDAHYFAASGDRLIMDTTHLFHKIVRMREDGMPCDELALYFHVQLADMTAAACREIRHQMGIGTAALSGGVFQNTLLLGLVKERLERDGFLVLHHHLIPPNDGGLAVGQALYGLAHLST